MDITQNEYAELVHRFARNVLTRREFVAGLAALGITPVPKPVREQPAAGKYVVLIVIDACRPSYLSLTSLPHINALMEQGVVYEQAWGGAMESETPAVHATLGTGTLPRESGFVGFGWVQPVTRQHVDFRTLLAQGRVDPVLRGLPVPSVAARLQQLVPGAVAVAASGHKDYAVVGLGGGAAKYQLYGKFTGKEFGPTYMHQKPPVSPAEQKSLTVQTPIPIGGEDAWAFRYAMAVVRKVRPKLLMLNLPEVDTWGHWYGPNDKALFSKLLLNIDRGIGALQSTYRALGILDQTNFIITADHGMMQSYPVHGWSATVAAAANAERTSVARVDGTTGAIWLHDSSQARGVAQRLVAAQPPHVSAIFYRSASGINYSYVQESPAAWLATPGSTTALQNLVATTAGKHGPDVWAIFRENCTASPRNVTGQWKGTHGGASWQAQHIPLILSGPDVRQGVRSQFPARSIDIAPTMEALLSLPPIERAGVPLADAFTSSMDAQSAMQMQVASYLQADVHALQGQSEADSVRLHLPSSGSIASLSTETLPRGTTENMPTCDC